MKKRIKFLLLTIAISLSCLLPYFMIATPSVAYASNVHVQGALSSALADLETDETFNAEDYPYNATDYSMQVIQVAESNEQDVYLYVYQPSSRFIATSVNMSLGKFDETNNSIYYLTYLNNNGVFYKYKINNLSVSTDAIRYYNIISIFRPYYSDLDTNVTDPNVSEISFPVATCYSIMTNEDGSISTCNSSLEVITITTKWTSFIRYSNGSTHFPSQHDAFFVAFDTDRQIDDLIDADISYVYWTYDCYENLLPGGGDGGLEVASLENDDLQLMTATASNDYSVMPTAVPSGHYSDYSEHSHSETTTVNTTLYADNEQTWNTSVLGFFKTKYTWNEIESVSDFINDPDKNLTTSTINMLADKKWVLNFHRASYSQGTEHLMGSPYKEWEKGTVVDDVTILRLKFETAGKTYNLGVIDNKQDSETTPAGTGVSTLDRLKAMLKTILILILIIFVVIILNPILPIIFKIIGWILKVILWIVSAPFKLLAKLFSSDKENSSSSSKKRKRKRRRK